MNDYADYLLICPYCGHDCNHAIDREEYNGKMRYMCECDICNRSYYIDGEIMSNSEDMEVESTCERCGTSVSQSRINSVPEFYGFSSLCSSCAESLDESYGGLD